MTTNAQKLKYLGSLSFEDLFSQFSRNTYIEIYRNSNLAFPTI